MRWRTSVSLILAGACAWFMPWTATASVPGALDVEIDCPAAPVELLVDSQLEGWSNDTTSHDAVVAGSAGACRASAWWRTMLGTVLVAVGLGRANRSRQSALRPIGRAAAA